MVITRATEYAIRALLHLSKQPRGQIVFKRDICQNQEITPAFLTKILQPLIKAGIVGSQRGVGGGFYLLKDPEEITLLDIVQAEEGPICPNHCLERPGICDRDQSCPVHGAWREVQGELLNVLGKYSFARLAETEAEMAGRCRPARQAAG